MSQLEMVNDNIRRASAILELGERVEKLLLTPSREVKVEVAVELDNGEVATYTGYRIQHNDARGPMKGGLRYHPTVDAEDANTGRHRSSPLLAHDLEDRGGEHPVRGRERRHQL
jgi:glutamate dehydrogenase (NAD(P)+)